MRPEISDPPSSAGDVPPEPVADSLTEQLDASGFAELSGATPNQLADLETFRSLLEDWGQRMNLVGPSALAQFWGRHAWDSAQLLQIAPEAATLADLGAGAGFPGLVLAIMLKGRTGAHVHLVESLTKRCRFLQTVVDELGLAATVHNARAETLTLKVDIVTARACAPMVRLLGYAKPFLKAGATGLFLKGRDVETELEQARETWVFRSELLPSRSGEGRIVRVTGPLGVRR